MKKIENIIFDLGNVILNIDYKKPIQKFIKLGLSDAANLYSKSSQIKTFDLLETGKISEQEFISEIQKLIPNATSEEIILSWNAILGDLPESRILLLQKLKDNFSLYLLSNTNCIHIKEIKRQLGKKEYAIFYNIFSKVYYSHEVGMRKPNPNIFNLILNENNLDQKKTLFIDDSIQHIESAKNIGLQTHHLLKSESIESIFPDIIL